MELKEELSDISDKSIYGKEFQVDDISDPASFPSGLTQSY